MHVADDMLFDLVRAVHAGDLEQARETISLMRASAGGGLAGLLIAARQAVDPLPPAERLAEPFVLPVPGHEPGMTLSGERLWAPDKPA